MSLLRLSHRPIGRPAERFRDDRRYIVACDDTYAPAQYFSTYQIPRIEVLIVPTPDGKCDAARVLGRLLEFDAEPYDERWLFLDVDHYAQGTHLASLTQTLREARRQRVKVALSKPCFELWLLLHHSDEVSVAELSNAKTVVSRLRKALGSYNKTKLDPGQFPLSAVPVACQRAASLDLGVAGGDIPSSNTTRVYRLWHSIVKNAHPSQVPEVLKLLSLNLERESNQ